MIKIQKYEDIEKDFFEGRPFDDANEVVLSVLDEVQKKGDAALRIYGQKFDVSVPGVFEVPQEELEMMIELVTKTMEDVVELQVPLKADYSYGNTWYDAK